MANYIPNRNIQYSVLASNVDNTSSSTYVSVGLPFTVPQWKSAFFKMRLVISGKEIAPGSIGGYKLIFDGNSANYTDVIKIEEIQVGVSTLTFADLVRSYKKWQISGHTALNFAGLSESENAIIEISGYVKGQLGGSTFTVKIAPITDTEFIRVVALKSFVKVVYLD